MIFPTFFLTPPPKNDENVKKSKNREHFIISVLKVGQGKNFLFLRFLYVFMLFWGGQKKVRKIMPLRMAKYVSETC